MASDRISPRRTPLRPPGLVPLVGGFGMALLMVVLFVVWFVVRVEVEPNQILVLVNKTGRPIPADLASEFSDQVVLYPELVKAIAARTGESEEQVSERCKGIRYEVLQEGRYFYNPYSYRREVLPATQVGDNEVGVLIRKFGKPLPFPKTVATESDERGPVAEILRPGRHNINLLAYDVQKFPAIQIPEGRKGVVTLLSGTDPKRKNTYTVEPGEKGVQRALRGQGLEYYNPYLERIEIVDLRSHKYDMLGQDAIHFPSNDSFTIRIEGTIEWRIMESDAAEVLVAYGDEEDILNKVLLPNARSISRIEGSKLRAREFISGTTRLEFQEHFFEQLRDECRNQGIEILDALVRDIQPPAEIANLISQREQADQEIERSTNEMKEARAQARLVEQQELEKRNSSLGNERRQVVSVVKEAEERKVVAVTDANRALEVAKLQLEAATKEAAALVSRGTAEANVVLLEFTAKAEPLKQAVAAFGDGETYAQLFFLEKIAPSIRSILANTEGPFADIFKQFQNFQPTRKEGGDQ